MRPMNKFIRLILGVLAIPLAQASIQSGADALINQVDPHINIGIQVVDLTTGALLYKRNAHRSFTPASNMKLFSNAAALMVLGPDYRFQNQLSTSSSQLQQGVLKGSLYLHLPGDPSFSRQRLARLFASLKKWRITRIQGDVIIDSSHNKVDAYAPGWMVEDLPYSYGAPLAPVMIDANRINATVNPASKAGAPAIVEVNDDSGSIAISNQVKTKARKTRCGVDFSMDRENHLTVRGCVAVGQWAVMQKMAIRNPMLYAQGLIKSALNDANITLDGSILLGTMPSGSMLLASDRSKPIAQLMADTLKPSDNLYAESLFLHAADKLHGSAVNWGEAQVLIKNFMQQETGIDLQKAVLTDGSGLSRYDLLTPAQTVSLLRFLFDRFPLTYEYIAALPVSGRDGTLQKRFQKPYQQDLVRAKTGTMTGVVSLSGYLYTANAHTLAFAIFINNLPGTSLAVSGRYRYLVDALGSYFLQQKPGSNSWSKMFASNKRIKFQLSPTQAQLQRNRQAKWRRLESVVKRALQEQDVTVLFRGDELILQDNQAEANTVMTTLQTLNKKYAFAVALASPTIPTSSGKPLMLWTKALSLPANSKRVWTLRETVSN